MLKVGIFGAGHLGKIHLEQWKQIEGIELIGFYDPDDQNAEEAEKRFGVPRFPDMEQLIEQIEIADIVSPTITHYELARICLLNGKHVFVEKPLVHTLDEAKELVKFVGESNLKCQVGHVERYNPAFLALQGQVLQPMFIEAHRLAQFNPRGTDVAVILDLMIHDIDLVLHLVKSPVRRISASGVAVMSESADMANARIEFDNGCVANLTASRISMKKMRKMRLFQRDAYIGIDFLAKKTEIIRMKESGKTNGSTSQFEFPIALGDGREKIISVDMPDISDSNAIKAELSDFILSIKKNEAPKVTVYDGFQAMDAAHQILRKMSMHKETHQV